MITVPQRFRQTDGRAVIRATPMLPYCPAMLSIQCCWFYWLLCGKIYDDDDDNIIV